MAMHKRIFLYKALCVSLVFAACAQPDKKEDVFSWPEIEKEHRPWTYWWWMGSAVNRNDITRILESFHTAGLGGGHIIPIYGVRGMEDRFLPYLGPAWMEHLSHTVKEAGRLGMGVDMTTGTGWPFGGPQVSAEEAAKKAVLKIVPAEQDHSLPVDASLPQAFVAVSEKGETDLLPLLDTENRLLEWPEGDTKLYWIGMALSGQKVKRAAPGASGYVLDPFSGKSMGIYLARFDSAFSGLPRGLLRSFYNDSYEV